MSDSKKTSPRVGIRDIAAAAEVSIMTVSLALRNHPKLSAATRKRVQQVAQRLGYRPDPEISRLMARLHHSRHPGSSPPLALVDFSPARQPPNADNYCEQVRRGAVARAESLGYITSAFHQLDYEGDFRRMLRVIHYRGIRGILVLPPTQPVELPAGLDWSSFSVLIASYAITPLEFHRVVPHQFVDMCSLLRLLASRGHRRIGAIFPNGFEERTQHHLTAAFSLLKHEGNILRVPDPANIDRDVLSRWLNQETPDVVVSTAPNETHAALPPATRDFIPPAVIGLGAGRTVTLPFWDECPQEIGSVAAVLLAGMIQHNETGVPASPRTTMVHGAFHEPSAKAGGAEEKFSTPASPRERSRARTPPKKAAR